MTIAWLKGAFRRVVTPSSAPAMAASRGSGRGENKRLAQADGSDHQGPGVRKRPAEADGSDRQKKEQKHDASVRPSWHLRQVLKCGLDMKMKYEVRGHGLMKTLTVDEMEQVRDRRLTHAAGVARIRKWVDDRGGLSPERGPASAVTFWHDLTGANKLPDHGFLGIASAVSAGKLSVILLSYQALSNVPRGVTIVDPRPYLPEQKFMALLSHGVHIALLADYIRFKAIAERAASSAWFVDCDSLWFKPPPCLAECAYGHCFASLKGDVQGTYEIKERYWLQNYLKKQGDHLFLASPFGFPKDSPVVLDMVSWFEEKFLAWETADGDMPIQVQYNDPFKYMRQRVTYWGLEGAAHDERAFSPLPYSSREKHIKENSYSNRLFHSVVHSAHCVNNFWASCKNTGGEDAHQRGSFSLVKPGSLWEALYKHACPAAVCSIQQVKGEEQSPGDAIAWPLENENRVFPSMTPVQSTPLYRKFELMCQVGSGSHGNVFKGQRRSDPSEYVAIKIVSSKSVTAPVDARELFYMQTLNDAQHVVRVLDGWMSPQVTVTVMEFARVDLYSHMKNLAQPLPKETAIAFFQGIAKGVAEIHAKGLIHRDLHSKNVLLCGPQLIAKICDLGSACSHVETQETASVGLERNVGALCIRALELYFCSDAAYDPQGNNVGPERCKYGPSIDLWSLGALLLCMDLGEDVFSPLLPEGETKVQGSSIFRKKTVLNIVGLCVGSLRRVWLHAVVTFTRGIVYITCSVGVYIEAITAHVYDVKYMFVFITILGVMFYAHS